MKLPQARSLEPESRVFRNIAAGAEVLALPGHKNTAQVWLPPEFGKNAAQVPPHLARHGIQARRMTQHDPRHATLQRETNAGLHARSDL
jgi:hypothetical protein